MKGKSLVVQWLGLCALSAKGAGSISSWRTNILQAMWDGRNKKQTMTTTATTKMQMQGVMDQELGGKPNTSTF